MTVGSVVFGPRADAESARLSGEWMNGLRTVVMKARGLEAHSCGCVGPQPGETKCPCALRAESRQGQTMIRNGVTIDGVEYELRRKR